MKNYVYCLLLALASFLAQTKALRGQDVLDKTISVEFRQQRLDQALSQISHKGNFYFSYNSNLLKGDSLVTLSAQGKSIRTILDLLFHGGLDYKVSGNYIILLRHAVKLPPGQSSAAPDDKRYTVSGFILDETTGEKVSKASVYDRHGLIATLSNENGFFTVRLKNRAHPAMLTVSKEFYEDTTINISPGEDQPISIVITPVYTKGKMVTITPDDYLQGDSIRVELQGDSGNTQILHIPSGPIQVEMTAWGKLLLSSRFTVQSINLRKFFTERAFQLSLIPGLGTDGLLSPQIANKISINLLWGYTGGLHGVELGGLFNIDKKKVSGFQAAGLVNVVGGPLQGVQLAGLNNTVLDSAQGFQAAGLANFDRKKFTGVQLAGLYNHVADSVTGVQAAGLLNYAKDVNGLQISGLINHAHRLKGVQIGLVNIADTSDGYSIGLFNYVKKGYRELSFFANEIAPLNVAFRSGNAKLYTILLAGINPDDKHRLYYCGFGLGHQFLLNQKLSLNPEISSEHLAIGDWNDFSHNNLVNRLSIDLHWRLSPHIALSAGPSLAIYTKDHLDNTPGHASSPLYDGYPTFTFSDKVSGWIGWHAAINFL